MESKQICTEVNNRVAYLAADNDSFAAVVCSCREGVAAAWGGDTNPMRSHCCPRVCVIATEMFSLQLTEITRIDLMTQAKRQPIFHPIVSHDGRINASHCLSSPWPGFNSQPWRRISRDFSLADGTHLERRLAPSSRHKPIERIRAIRSNTASSARSPPPMVKMVTGLKKAWFCDSQNLKALILFCQ